jgi:hypothetical protein
MASLSDGVVISPFVQGLVAIVPLHCRDKLSFALLFSSRLVFRPKPFAFSRFDAFPNLKTARFAFDMFVLICSCRTLSPFSLGFLARRRSHFPDLKQFSNLKTARFAFNMFVLICSFRIICFLPLFSRVSSSQVRLLSHVQVLVLLALDGISDFTRCRLAAPIDRVWARIKPLNFSYFAAVQRVRMEGRWTAFAR